MKYKVGDIVKVREDLKVGYDYKLYVTNEMAELAGKLVTIRDMDNDYYSIKEDKKNYLWIDDFFEDKEKEKKSDMKLRDFLNNFVDVGKTVIDLYFNVTYKVSIGYNLIEKNTEEWNKLLDIFGDKKIESWNVDIYKKDEYSEYPRIEVRCK